MKKIVKRVLSIFKKKETVAPKAPERTKNKGPLYQYRTNK